MQNTGIAVIFGIMVVAVTALAACSSAGEWEYRGRVEMVGPVENDVDLRILTEVRSRNDLHTHNESHFDIGLEWKLSDWLSVGPYYRHVTEEKSEVWRVEHRPHLDATFRWGAGPLGLSNRNRLEYRMMGGDESFRFRTRIMLKVSTGRLPGIQPYVSEEPYYDLKVGELNKNRFTAGLDVKVLSSIRIGVNYIVDSTRRTGHWEDINALTLVLKYRP